MLRYRCGLILQEFHNIFLTLLTFVRAQIFDVDVDVEKSRCRDDSAHFSITITMNFLEIERTLSLNKSKTGLVKMTIFFVLA